MSRQVVTASLLEDLRRSGQAIAIERDALLTPSARDWLREKPLPVTWLESGSSGRPAKYGLIAEESEPAQRSLATSLERAFGQAERIGPGRDRNGMIAATNKLTRGIRRSRLTHGIVLADDAALVSCLANKCAGVRAAAVSSLDALDDAIRLLGINVLILETGRVTFHQVRQMVGKFLRSACVPEENVASALKELESPAGESGGER